MRGGAGSAVGGHDIRSVDRFNHVTVDVSNTESDAAAILIQRLDVALVLNDHRRMPRNGTREDLLVDRLRAEARRLRTRLDHRRTYIDLIGEHQSSELHPVKTSHPAEALGLLHRERLGANVVGYPPLAKQLHRPSVDPAGPRMSGGSGAALQRQASRCRRAPATERY